MLHKLPTLVLTKILDLVTAKDLFEVKEVNKYLETSISRFYNIKKNIKACVISNGLKENKTYLFGIF
jgi:hypothetical protein